MPTVTVADAELFYEEGGNPSGEPLVLVHGFAGSGASWEHFLSRFGDYRLIVPDLRGHRKSSGSVDSIHHARFAADIIALLDHLAIGRAHFVGHSSGGMCLLFVGSQRPDRVQSLALVAATYTFDDRAKSHMRQLMAQLPSAPERIADLERIHGPYRGAGYWQTLRAAFLEFTNRPDELPFSPATLGAIRSPVLVLHGDRDEFFPVDVPVSLYQALPHAELCILPNTAHDLPVQQPELFVHIVRDFLARHSAE
jgi:pimeloyl-ACP methyl ester carboxylesterase